MVRTKADRVPRKAIGGKVTAKKSAPVKINTPKKSTGSKGAKKQSGGNPYHPRETPKWQKSITCFISKSETTSEATASETSSSNFIENFEDQKDEKNDIKENIEDDDDDDESD
ncbi:PCNA-associated factor-like [Odontomachus brunneus]|uniref:PCNA-associated factor-like n=1 Tax=Odontomachus brunneus TaxID=486640 RepID=UPI0013F23A56|nr:PCNA-associated factor-like [Odontomachus brunneus]